MTLDGHSIQEENIGAYLLGALPDVEARRFESHAEQCPICADELARLRPAVEALPRSVVPMQAPPSLRATIMEEVDADVRSRESVLGGPGRLRVGLRNLRERFAGGAGLRPGVAWVSVAFVLLVGVFAGFAIEQLRSDDPGSRTLAAAVDKDRMPSASGSFVVPAGLEEGGVLRVHGMADLDRDTVYEVWIQRDGEMIAQSLFRVDEDGDGAAAVADDLDGADAVLVTREPARGSKAPTEDAVLKVSL